MSLHSQYVIKYIFLFSTYNALGSIQNNDNNMNAGSSFHYWAPELPSIAQKGFPL